MAAGLMLEYELEHKQKKKTQILPAALHLDQIRDFSVESVAERWLHIIFENLS